MRNVECGMQIERQLYTSQLRTPHFLSHPYHCAHLSHRLTGDLSGLALPLTQHIVYVVAVALPIDAFFAEPGQVVEDMADHDFLAFQATNAGGATAGADKLDLLWRTVEPVEVKGRTVSRFARVAAPHSTRVGHHTRELGVHLFGWIGKEHGIAIALAHLATIDPGNFWNFGQQRLGLRKDLSIERVEAPGDLARDLDMWHLVHSYRYPLSFVDEDVSGLQDRVA